MIAWILPVLAVVAVPFGLIMALRTRPAVFPYTTVAYMKCIGIAGPVVKNFVGAKETPDEFFKILGQLDLASAKRIRDAMLELDRVPTIAKGLKALGYKSTIEALVKRDFFKRTSPYTHPLQQPYIFVPGIPAHTFYDPSEFEWAKILEDNYDVIRAELDAVLADGGKGFTFYRSELVTDEKYWNNFNFFLQGKKIEENCARMPRTTAILESLPRFEKNHIMFSALNPKSHLARHVGPINGVLRGHLPMIVPKGCRIQVGDDVREWEEGKVMVFDDSFFHEVWNDSDQLRIVLFMNFWHPAIAEEDIPAIERFRHIIENEFPVAVEYLKRQEAPRSHTIERGPIPNAS